MASEEVKVVQDLTAGGSPTNLNHHFPPGLISLRSTYVMPSVITTVNRINADIKSSSISVTGNRLWWNIFNWEFGYIRINSEKYSLIRSSTTQEKSHFLQ